MIYQKKIKYDYEFKALSDGQKGASVDEQLVKTFLIVIITLLGFLQTIFMFILGYLFKINGTIFAKMDTNKKDCLERIDKNADQEKKDKVDLESKITTLLNEHYATNGKVNTLREEQKGELKGLPSAIETLTKVIQNKL